jgi:hypothetical protein
VGPSWHTPQESELCVLIWRGGTRSADRVVDQVAPSLFQTEDMRAAVAALVEHGARNFRDKVVFQGR